LKVFATEDIRNIVIMGHGSVGKTTLGEAALFASGATTRMGSVEEQNSAGDYDEDEHKRRFSINLALLPLEWEGKKLNFIDTPGYADFVSEVICGARAAESALILVDAVVRPRSWYRPRVADRRAAGAAADDPGQPDGSGRTPTSTAC